MSSFAFLCPTLHQWRQPARSTLRNSRYPPDRRHAPSAQRRRFAGDAALPPFPSTATSDSSEPSTSTSTSPRFGSIPQEPRRERQLLAALRAYSRRRAEGAPLPPPTGPRKIEAEPPMPSKAKAASMSSALQPDYFSRAIQRTSAVRSTYHYRKLVQILDSPYLGSDPDKLLQYCTHAWEVYTTLCDFVGARALDGELHRRVLRCVLPAHPRPMGKKAESRWSEPMMKTLDERMFTILRLLRLSGSTPEEEDYLFLLSLCAQTGRYETALLLKEQLESDGLKLGEEGLLALLGSFKSRRKGSRLFVRTQAESAHIAKQLESVLLSAQASAVPLTPRVLDAIARLLREINAQEQLEDLFRTHYGLDLKYPDRVSEEFVQRWGEGTKLPGISTDALNTLLRAMSWRREPWRALLVYEVLCHPLPSPSSPAFASLASPAAPAPAAQGEGGEVQAGEGQKEEIQEQTQQGYEDDDDEWGEPASLPWGHFPPLHPNPYRRPIPNVTTYETLIAAAYWGGDQLLLLHFLACAISEEKRITELSLRLLRDEGRFEYPRMRVSYKAAWLVASLLSHRHVVRELMWVRSAVADLCRWRREILGEFVLAAEKWVDVGKLYEENLGEPVPDFSEVDGDAQGAQDGTKGEEVKEGREGRVVMETLVERAREEQRRAFRMALAAREGKDWSEIEAEAGGAASAESGSGEESFERADRDLMELESGSEEAYEASLDQDEEFPSSSEEVEPDQENSTSEAQGTSPPKSRPRGPMIWGTGPVVPRTPDDTVRFLYLHISETIISSRQMEHFVDLHLPNALAAAAAAHARRKEKYEESLRQRALVKFRRAMVSRGLEVKEPKVGRRRSERERREPVVRPWWEKRQAERQAMEMFVAPGRKRGESDGTRVNWQAGAWQAKDWGAASPGGEGGEGRERQAKTGQPRPETTKPQEPWWAQINP